MINYRSTPLIQIRLFHMYAPSNQMNEVHSTDILPEIVKFLLKFL